MVKTTVQRRRHTNSKLGCLNCKRKKVRCDESLPECKNCLKGKKETCSYLSLTNQEIQKIKLTHSLRNSQNKLLDQKYRLPASGAATTSSKHSSTSSSNETTGDKDSETFSSGDILDFKFELKDLPINIPSIAYPPLQFDNISINDFSGDGVVHNDVNKTSEEDDDDQEEFEEVNGNGRNHSNLAGLNKFDNGVHSPTTFNCLNRSIFRRVHADSVKTKVPADFSFHVVLGKSNLLDHLSDMMLDTPATTHRNVFSESLLCLGETIILKVFNKRQKILGTYDHSELNFISWLNKKCLDRHGFCQEEIKNVITSFHKNLGKVSSWELEKQIHLGAYVSYLLNFVVLMLKFGAQAYFDSSKGIFQSFEAFLAYIQKYTNQPSTTVDFLMTNIQYNIMSINVPSYPPQFLFEIESNLRSLEFVFVRPTIFQDESINQRFQKIEYHFKSLIKFFSGYVLPIVYASRDENSVSIYPPEAIYEIFQEWHTNVPSETMNHHQSIDTNNFSESEFLNDLSTTLYMYYYAVAAALDAVFPGCKYLYGVSFMLPTNKFFHNMKIMTISKDNFYLERLYPFKVDILLQRHVFYASRLFGFFRRRFCFYHNYTDWSSPFDDSLKANRFKSRTIRNSFEAPIHSFNTTLIRPEHYPIRDEKVSLESIKGYPIYTREDDTIKQQFYARNIETLDFFNLSQILQYDCESMLLLRDYRPFDDQIGLTRSSLGMDVIKDYYNDKTIILDSLFSLNR
ncbi:conserved hypothetical protein [Candida dubliniensis CD36]|uniref:Zn(2)-C6 fungal-type domain-containing protein n=1 Tax=Candida dubliniensis (strain CD36 / ATCC MYA-646 / CBS 7987 / NCPF 3949 / NRRL Y-17841) TaxID=573826 RepID=B9W6R6_CANDC|nr:conserved hypothetical protein [Candida dubliniensis CD36]CAX44371.1 conserved hypothetical protein [Candida dubliniensis CD36]